MDAAPGHDTERDDVVDVWHIDLHAIGAWEASFRALLTDEERARAARYRGELLQARFVLARGALRAILGRYAGVDPREIRFAYGKNGKPELAGGPGPSRLEFNLSHSHDRAAVALARGRPVGVDLEQHRPMEQAERVVQRFFSPQEVAEFLALPEAQRERAFLHGWTRKEAILKALGVGLSGSMETISVPMASHRLVECVRVEAAAGAPEGWGLRDLAFDDGYCGAVAARGDGWELRCFAFEPPVHRAHS